MEISVKNNYILLHVCCAVCSAFPVIKLKNLNYTPILYFYNPNIYPKSEYFRRLKELILYSKKLNIKLIIDHFQPIVWQNYIKGLESEMEKGLRCNKCFELRLTQTYLKAAELNIPFFSTTLTVSPHKISKNIFNTAFNIQNKFFQTDKFNPKFVDIDFKKENGFLETIKIAKLENFYRQNYCGCQYSIRQ